MRAAARHLCLLLVVTSISSCARARIGAWNALSATGDRVEIHGTAGTGFAGVRIAEVLQQPAPCLTCAMALAADSVDLIANERISWRPALSTGVRWLAYSRTTSQAGGGLGAHIVFVPDASRRTAPVPGLTAHFGNRNTEVFFGTLFMESDEVRFPNGGNSVRVAPAPGGAYPDFVVRNTRGWSPRKMTFYMGVQIAGLRVGERTAQEAAELADQRSVRTIAVDSVVSLRVGSTHRLNPRLLDADGRPLSRTVVFGTADPAVVEVSADGTLSGIKAGGPIPVTLTSSGVAATVQVTVVEPDSE